jgi:hypothetical protein
MSHVISDTSHLKPASGARPAFRLLHPLPIPVKAVAARRATIDTLQPIRPVPLIRRRSRRRHITGIVIREINRRASVVIAARTVIDGCIARSDFRECHSVRQIPEVVKAEVYLKVVLTKMFPSFSIVFCEEHKWLLYLIF